jgi:hypothetical protein
VPIGSLLPLAILAGGYAYDEDETADLAVAREARVA